ncbi:MAG TPA: shikimate kinase [Bryobacteraceae bacterium]|jgi:shikimate kinase|nr:shikimate kinase [Bryobacteraceae bacterium]
MTLKLKRTPGLYLVGFMGSGKTTIGRSLAEELGWNFLDIDKEIERLEGKSIRRIFAEDGEERFRDLESATLARTVSGIQAGNPCVVAAGGGAFVQQHNWEIVENNGVTVWLDCDLETIELRLGAADDERPLYVSGSMREIYEKRRPHYAQADFHVDANCSEPSQVLQQILHLPIF